MAYEIYPTSVVKRFFKACRKDQLFKIEMAEAEGTEFVKPTAFSNGKTMVIYAATYAGWLLGKGDIKKYKELDNGME
jgi:hypothetical protein